MIRLDSFIKGIHQAIMTANESLMRKNTGLIKAFFDPIPSDVNVIGKIGKIRKLRRKDGRIDSNFFNSRLKPKCVVLQYPNYTKDGLEMVDVEVPLITLVPLNLSQVEKVKLSMDVVLSLDDEGAVNISFEKKKPPRRPLFRTKPKWTPQKVGNIEITIRPHEGSEGLRMLVEKYEKVLRAQIPD